MDALHYTEGMGTASNKVFAGPLPAQRRFPLVRTHAVRVADPEPIVRHLAAVPDRIAAHPQERLLNPGDDLPVVAVATGVAALRPHLAQLALSQLIVVAVIHAPVRIPVPVPVLCRFRLNLIMLGNAVI